MASSLPLSFVADLSSYLDEGKVVAFNIGPNGYAYVVIAQKPLDCRVTVNRSKRRHDRENHSRPAAAVSRLGVLVSDSNFITDAPDTSANQFQGEIHLQGGQPLFTIFATPAVKSVSGKQKARPKSSPKLTTSPRLTPLPTPNLKHA